MAAPGPGHVRLNRRFYPSGRSMYPTTTSFVDEDRSWRVRDLGSAVAGVPRTPIWEDFYRQHNEQNGDWSRFTLTLAEKLGFLHDVSDSHRIRGASGHTPGRVCWRVPARVWLGPRNARPMPTPAGTRHSIHGPRGSSVPICRARDLIAVGHQHAPCISCAQTGDNTLCPLRGHLDLVSSL